MGLLSTQWKDIFYTQIAFYAIMLAGGFSLLLRLFKFSRNHGGGFYFKKLQVYVFLLPLFKIVGAVCAIVTINGINDSKVPKEGIIIVAVMFNTICVGFLLNMTISLLRHIDNTDTKYIADEMELPDKEEVEITSSDSKYYMGVIEKRLDTLVSISNILVIVGASMSSSDMSTARSLIIASSILFLVSGLVVIFMLVKKYLIWRSTHNEIDDAFNVGKILSVIPIFIPFLLIRIIYSICSAFGFKGYDLIDVSQISKYAIIFGDWKLYLGMAFVEECIVVLGIIFVGHLINHKK